MAGKVRNAADVFFVIKTYCAYEMEFDDFIKAVYEHLYIFFYKPRERIFSDEYLYDKYSMGRSFYAHTNALYQIQNLFIRDLVRK